MHIEQADGLHYVSRIVNCRLEEYFGEEIEFYKRYILLRESPLAS